MNKTLIIILNLCIIAVILVVLLIAVYPFIRYSNMDESVLNIWIVDKTVPNPDYREHTGFLWVLNSMKILNEKTDEHFEFDNDYYGFYPIDAQNFEIKEIPDVVEYPHLMYLADTYGVYVDDFFKENLLGTKSDIIYGGFNMEEVEILKSNLGGGNTIIGEFNIAQFPTYNPAADALGEIFRMEWTHWCGRYFFDLTEGVEAPVWAVDYYEQSTGLNWEFTGEGYIFVNDFSRVVIFEKDKHFTNDYVTIEFDEKYYDEFDIKGSIPYEYWFEYTVPDASTEVLAEFTFHVTDEGQELLDEIGLSAVFPAITRNKNSMYTSYYFAGDFADGIVDFRGPWTSYYDYANIKRALPMGELGDNKTFYWKVYVPMMEKIMDDIVIKVALDDIEEYDDGLQYNVKTTNSTFQTKNNGEFEDMFIKGVNIGSSTPGKWFTEFSNDESMFLEWFEQIADMNANTVRAYTLLSPQFYTAFVHYNEANPDKPLWLYQEIWPEENPDDNDYLREGYVEEYLQEIEYVINAINGNAYIPFRKGRAYGIYTSDVSPYLAGYMIGRELLAEEVQSTNDLHPGYTYAGEYIYTSFDASPTEAWLAMCCDYTIKYETDTYQWQHPVGIVSWPTLDVAVHDSEWNAAGDKSLEFNDSISIDINNLLVTDKLNTGLFGAYHIYPNYPDFMNNEKSYAEYEDEHGVFRYGGYLQEFMQTHSKYPAIVAEFGLATGMSIAHSNPDGYMHGGMTEQQQGDGIVRMFEAIKRENYAGGIIFEWSDEWSKKTWNTESYIIPFDRNVMWHGMTDPEQNYGIIAMEATEYKSPEYTILGDGHYSRVTMQVDEEYLHIEIEMDSYIDFDEISLTLGLDTYNRERGNFMFPNNNYTIGPIGLEYLITIDGIYDAQILVNPSYNTTKGTYQSRSTYSGVYDNIVKLVNIDRITKDGEVIDAIYFDESQLRYGSLEDNAFYAWTMDGNIITMRIPWMLLNFSDPSEMRILDDPSIIYYPLRDQIETSITDGIMIYGIVFDRETGKALSDISSVGMNPFSWDRWDIPDYEQRAKESYYIIQDYFSNP